MAGDIVPIEIGLTSGDLVTLWAPRWREGDDEWEAFLGHEEDLYGFASVAELAAFIRTDTDNDLVDHPAWSVVAGLSAAELEPEENFTFDFVGVPELAAGDPEPLVVSELEDTLNMARNIGEVCELDSVIRFFSGHPILGALATGASTFDGREGLEIWDQVGAAIAKDWDKVLDAIDNVVTSPKVDAGAVAVAEAELLAAAENTVDADDVAEEGEDEEFDEDDLDEEDEIETFWGEVGVDPVRIITSADTFYTLRCYMGEQAIFLGKDGLITVFRSERALARYLADNHEHDLSQVSTYGLIQNAAVDGSLDIEVTDENVYVLPGIADDLAQGPDAVDVEQLELAVELFTDAADFADDDSTEETLSASNELGWYVSYLLNPDPSRMAPSAPFTKESEGWRELEREFETRLRPE